MKILVNGLLLNNNFTGVQYYTENLFNEISKQINDKSEISIILPSEYKGKLKSNTIRINSLNVYSKNRLSRILYENINLPFKFKNKSFNILHSPSYLLPFFFNSPSVLTVHDLIAINHPQFSQYESAVYYKLLQKKSISQATKIIAVSETVKNEIIQKYNVPSEKIVTIYHGVNEIFKKEKNAFRLNEVKVKYNLPDKFILFVGNIEPKKNLERLIKAFHLLRKNSEIIHKLIIVGKKGWKYNNVFKLVTDLKLKEDVIFTSYIPENDLPVIYSLADIFVFPSLYEGFGIPPLEAMACEVPVLISNCGALPEITGNNCIQVNPYEIEAIAAGMYNLITEDNLKVKSIEDGINWVKRFTWQKAAKETLKVYERTGFEKGLLKLV